MASLGRNGASVSGGEESILCDDTHGRGEPTDACTLILLGSPGIFSPYGLAVYPY